ncbi:hypothetical protein D3C78_1942370 [compost metagenome]
MAASTPAEPKGANPWLCRFSGLKKLNNTTITNSGTTNLITLIRLLDLAKVLTL